MCGILAHYLFDRSGSLDESLLREMADTMTHRGPDDAGYWVDGQIGLAHRRLSIIDLSPDGRQPMVNEDGSVRLTFNGEIYNFPSLRKELLGRGYRFRSRSDTEVILHGYQEWGVEGCLKRLRGMFAFVIWDSKRQLLFAARDRLGIKPLYYRLDDSSLIMASEIKAILRHPEVAAGVDTVGLLQHFAHRFTLPPRTAFEGISKLSAGHYLLCQDGKTQIHEYWRPPGPEAEIPAPRSFDSWVEELREKLLETVEGHLISDVPVGAFLSGGLDSGSLVAMAASFSDHPIRTYTAGFGTGWHDESKEAREVSTFYQTDHHEALIKPTSAELLEKIVWHLEEPLINTSVIPLYTVSELAKREVTVVLAGEGSDEVNGGYQRYSKIGDLMRMRRLRRSLPGLDTALNFVSGMLPSSPFITRVQRMNRITHARCGEYVALTTSALGIEGGGQRSLFNPDINANFNDMALEAESTLLDGYHDLPEERQKFFIYDMRGWLANELLIRADKISMAHSLEARVPYLDHELVEFCLSMPSEMKFRNGATKALLRKAMQPSLPEQTSRRKQHGFVVPIGEWIRGDWRELVMDLSRDPRTRSRSIFDAGRIDEIIDEHMNGRADWTSSIFGFLITEIWHRTYLDG